MKQSKKFILIVVFFIIFLTAIILAIVLPKIDWQYISDQNKASNFVPTSDIEDIADNLTLTERGRAVFYASSPVLMIGEAFDNECDNYKNDIYLSGCYYKDINGDEHIIIYNVGSDTLNENGVSYDFSSYRRIVALHEFLHAVWARLSDSVQQDTCADLSIVANQIPDLVNELSTYDGSELCTEMFARVGSEYMPSFMNDYLYKDSDIPTRLKNLSSDAQDSVNDLKDVYNTYFNIYNTGLAIDHWKNVITLKQFENSLANFESEINANSQTIDQMIILYYQSPSRSFYYTVMAAIENHNENIERYNSYVETHNKIYEILDSTKLRTNTDYVDL